MPSSPISLVTLGGLTGAMTVGFGLNALLRPENGLSFFEVSYPSSADISALATSVRVLNTVYAIRDITLGLAILAGAVHGTRKTLGYLVLCMSATAFGDGIVCLQHGTGAQMNHFGYAPLIGLVGLALLR